MLPLSMGVTMRRAALAFLCFLTVPSAHAADLQHSREALERLLHPEEATA